MQKPVSVKDIAQQLHISLSTVHKALTGKPGISEQRRLQVLETAQRMGYEVNSVAQSLSRKNITIGILMPSGWQDYFADMSAGMLQAIEELNDYKVSGLFYYLTADLTEEDIRRILAWIEEKRIDALVYCPSLYRMQSSFLQALEQAEVPFFLAGDSYEELPGVTAVFTDSARAGKLAADFLRCVWRTDLRAAVFTGSMKVKSHKDKVEAFARRVEEMGGTVHSVWETMDEPSKTEEAIARLADADINAIYVTTATCVPICRFLERQKLQDRITLVCTDLFEELKGYMKKDIVKATIVQNQEQVGRMAIQSAYAYLVRKNSYGNRKQEPESAVCVRPNLYLLADID